MIFLPVDPALELLKARFAASRAKVLALSLVLSLCVVAGMVNVAEAAKKGKQDDAAAAEAQAKAAQEKEEAEIKKAVDPLATTLADLMRKYESRQLFSPEDAGKLSEAKYKMMDLMNLYPKSAMLTKPLFQAGFLLAERGQYDEAYELLNFLSLQQPQSPYGAKAKVRLYQLQKRLGPEYFQALEAASAPNAPPAEADPAAKDVKK